MVFQISQQSPDGHSEEKGKEETDLVLLVRLGIAGRSCTFHIFRQVLRDISGSVPPFDRRSQVRPVHRHRILLQARVLRLADSDPEDHRSRAVRKDDSSLHASEERHKPNERQRILREEEVVRSRQRKVSVRFLSRPTKNLSFQAGFTNKIIYRDGNVVALRSANVNSPLRQP